MATYYDILGVPPTSTREELKKSYHNLARELHPDRNTTQTTSTTHFHNVDEAWKVLSDVTLRKQYDARVKASESESVHPVQEEINISDTFYNVQLKQYEKDCRCGGCYVLSETDLCEELLIVDCDNCSLSIVVDCDGSGSKNKNVDS